MSSSEDGKRAAADRALALLEPGTVVGVGTGSTVRHFIEGLGRRRHDVAGAVSSSEQSSVLLREQGIQVLDLNAAGDIPLYVDGADECDPRRCLIKGGGAALTREKIIAAVATRFVCIIDAGKRVDVLGRFPLPVEVIPMARSHVARQLAAMGGQPVWREGVVTDNGNWILDLHGVRIVDPVALEAQINQIVGVVTVGLFARRPADLVLIGADDQI
jgi:ribose 5-phosphate isomerase A